MFGNFRRQFFQHLRIDAFLLDRALLSGFLWMSTLESLSVSTLESLWMSTLESLSVSTLESLRCGMSLLVMTAFHHYYTITNILTSQNVAKVINEDRDFL